MLGVIEKTANAVKARKEPIARQANDTGTKRYNLVIPDDVYAQLQAVADRQKTTVTEVLRTFIKIGLLVDRVNQSSGKLILRENNVDREIVLL